MTFKEFLNSIKTNNSINSPGSTHSRDKPYAWENRKYNGYAVHHRQRKTHECYEEIPHL
jgi:hypothetical protein